MKAPTRREQALSGLCRGGPLNGKLHSVLTSSRRLDMDGGSYFYSPDPKGHHVGKWRWVESTKAKT